MKTVQGNGKSALVTGATGVIGPVLVRKLVDADYAVRVLARRPVPPGLLPSQIDVINGDITHRESVERAVSGVDYVFHLAAKLHINNPSPELSGEYRRVNVDGTQLVVAAACAAGVQRLVFFSSIAVYGATHRGSIVTENSVTSSDTLYGATKREAEGIVLAARRADGVPLGVVLRIAGVYGPRIKGNYRSLVRWLRRGMFTPVGSGTNRRTLIHDDDVAAAAVLAAEHPAAVGMIFNVTDGSIHTFNEIVGAIAREIGRAPPRFHISEPVARFAGGVADSTLRLIGRPAAARPLIEKLTEDMAVSGQRIQETLGFRPQFDLQTGWHATIPQLVEN